MNTRSNKRKEQKEVTEEFEGMRPRGTEAPWLNKYHLILNDFLLATLILGCRRMPPRALGITSMMSPQRVNARVGRAATTEARIRGCFVRSRFQVPSKVSRRVTNLGTTLMYTGKRPRVESGPSVSGQNGRLGAGTIGADNSRCLISGYWGVIGR